MAVTPVGKNGGVEGGKGNLGAITLPRKAKHTGCESRKFSSIWGGMEHEGTYFNVETEGGRLQRNQYRPVKSNKDRKDLRWKNWEVSTSIEVWQGKTLDLDESDILGGAAKIEWGRQGGGNPV